MAAYHHPPHQPRPCDLPRCEGAKLPECGPKAHALCPWRQPGAGGDQLCCAEGARAGEGQCMSCASAASAGKRRWVWAPAGGGWELAAPP